MYSFTNVDATIGKSLLSQASSITNYTGMVFSNTTCSWAIWTMHIYGDTESIAWDLKYIGILEWQSQTY